MSSGGELKPSPSAAAPVDNTPTAAAAASTKRLRGDAHFVGGIGEDDADRTRPPKQSRTWETVSSAAASDMTLQHTLPTHINPTPVALVDVRVNGLFFRKFRVNMTVERSFGGLATTSWKRTFGRQRGGRSCF